MLSSVTSTQDHGRLRDGLLTGIGLGTSPFRMCPGAADSAGGRCAPTRKSADRPIARDRISGHRRYDEDVDTLQALACLRARGVGIDDMRAYQANREHGHAAAAEQLDLLLRHGERIEAEIAILRIPLEYLREKAALWDARDRGDANAEAEAMLWVQCVSDGMSPVLVTVEPPAFTAHVLH